MVYEKELGFFRKVLNNFRIQSCLITENDTSYRNADNGLRDFLGMQEDYDQLFCTPHETIKENVIYKITDTFFMLFGMPFVVFDTGHIPPGSRNSFPAYPRCPAHQTIPPAVSALTAYGWVLPGSSGATGRNGVHN